MARMGWIAAMFAATAMLLSGGALAQKQSETGWYAGVSLGSNDDLDDEPAWKIFGGYQINRNVAFEFGYANLGESSPGFGVSAEASAWELIGLYKLPLQDRFSIYGLASLARVEGKATVPFFGTVSDTDTDLTFGFGVQYDFSPKVAARLQFQDYDEFSVISVGVVYKF
jgi:OOP family OmpA-OmpF porin